VGIHRLLHSSCCFLHSNTAITQQLIGTARTLEAELWQVCRESWVRGQRKMSQVQGAFGLPDFTMLRPVFAWRAFLKLWTVYFFNFFFGLRPTADAVAACTRRPVPVSFSRLRIRQDRIGIESGPPLRVTGDKPPQLCRGPVCRSCAECVQHLCQQELECLYWLCHSIYTGGMTYVFVVQQIKVAGTENILFLVWLQHDSQRLRGLPLFSVAEESCDWRSCHKEQLNPESYIPFIHSFIFIHSFRY